MEKMDTSKKNEARMTTPWIEKYRPKTLKDVVGNKVTVERFVEFSKTGNVPNLLISGPPGCGKTTSVWALARDLLGPAVKDACLELNASDDRGIDVVRNRIKTFAQTKVTLPPGRHKIIILDEADSMTEGAQQALRRIMEIYSATTRFAFACNQSDKIIEPLQSRCAIVKYGKLTDREMLERVVYICDEEKVNYTDDGLKAILFTAQGDLRQAINNLQCTAAGFDVVNAENVYKVCDEPEPQKLVDMFESCCQADLNDAFRVVDELYKKGYSVEDILSSMFKTVKVTDIPEILRLEFIKEIGKVHVLVVQGVANRVQLAGLIARLCMKQEELSKQ